MLKDVLYMGDTSYGAAASYLTLAMHHAGISFDYVPTSVSLDDSYRGGEYGLYIFSDYPASQVSSRAANQILTDVKSGSGLLMIGGWESFQGSGGGYHGAPLADALPVRISRSDDRINSADPCCVVQCAQHQAIDGVDFTRPPTIAGFNMLEAADDSDVVLEVIRYATLSVRDVFSPVTFEVKSRDPYLVFGSYGSGKTGALASDLAPHWVGGFVDWGEDRIRIAHDDREVEVGSTYIQFVTGLIRWLAR
ncbi:MAG: hypothetical protein CMN78_06555 [Spirochaetales bacterium]|nr:hypothetical protein [Spirochaetales bacterium]